MQVGLCYQVKVKPPYRSLDAKEQELLFSFYDKWGGNIMAMVRDGECPFRARNQISYYKELYGFEAQFIQTRAKRCEAIIEQLGNNKTLAIQRAYELLQGSQVPVVVPATGKPLLDEEGKSVFIEVKPTYKEIEAAWKIIRTELGEPTSISKGDVTSGGKPIQGNAITFVPFVKTDDGTEK